MDFVINLLVDLEVEFFALQELWDFAAIQQALPPCFACFTGTAVGCGTGFMVGWLRTHQHRATRSRIEHDACDLLVATVGLTPWGSSSWPPYMCTSTQTTGDGVLSLSTSPP